MVYIVSICIKFTNVSFMVFVVLTLVCCLYKNYTFYNHLIKKLRVEWA